MWWTIVVTIYLIIATIVFYVAVTNEEIQKEAEKDYEELQREEGIPGMERIVAKVVKTFYIGVIITVSLLWIVVIPISYFIKDKDRTQNGST